MLDSEMTGSNQQVSKLRDKPVMGLNWRFDLFEAQSEQRGVRGVEHSVIRPIAGALSALSCKQRTRRFQGALSLLKKQLGRGVRRQNRRPSRRIFSMSLGFPNIPGSANSSSHRGSPSTITPVSIITWKAIAAKF